MAENQATIQQLSKLSIESKKFKQWIGNPFLDKNYADIIHL